MTNVHPSFQGNRNAKPGKPSEPVYEILVEKDLNIPMRDGTIIKCDVYRPKADGTFPVIMESTPYSKSNSSEMKLGMHSYFVPRGYVFICRDVRGRYLSEGEFTMHWKEHEDGYDAVEWAAVQPWSNGKVGLSGTSYGGQMCLHTAVGQPPSLVCITPALTSADLWREWYYRGGAMEMVFLMSWSAQQFGPDQAKRRLKGEALERVLELIEAYNTDAEALAKIIPVSDFKPSRITHELDQFKDWVSHPTDGPFWWKKNLQTYVCNVNVPALHIGGWYDIFTAGTIKCYKEIELLGATARARTNQRMMIGPWYHRSYNIGDEVLGIVNYGPGVNEPPFNVMRHEFVDYWLKDIKHDTFDLDKPVYVFTSGINKWRRESDWPLPDTDYSPFYFHGGKSGSIDSLNDGTLSAAEPVKDEKPQTYVYDPMKPAPTRGGGILWSFAAKPDGEAVPGGHDQQVVDRASLTFTSEPLTEPLEITGHVRAVLYAASDCVDTDWVVRLCEVQEDGVSVNLVDGILRARFRTSGINPTLIEPGKVYEYEVDLWSTSHVFLPGKRIRVTVNSSSFPRWSRNMNVAEFPEFATEWKVANNTVYMDTKYPSHIMLPVIKR